MNISLKWCNRLLLYLIMLVRVIYTTCLFDSLPSKVWRIKDSSFFIQLEYQTGKSDMDLADI